MRISDTGPMQNKLTVEIKTRKPRQTQISPHSKIALDKRNCKQLVSLVRESISVTSDRKVERDSEPWVGVSFTEKRSKRDRSRAPHASQSRAGRRARGIETHFEHKLCNEKFCCGPPHLLSRRPASWTRSYRYWLVKEKWRRVRKENKTTDGVRKIENGLRHVL